MSIESLLMAGLMAFVLLVPTLMVAVLVSGLARRDGADVLDTAGPRDTVEPVELPVAA